MFAEWLEDLESPDLDDFTKGTLSEIARDEAFLLTVDDYLHRTQVLH